MKKMAPALIALFVAAPMLAQEGTKFYRLDFALKEMDENKVVSQKNYSTFMSTDDRVKGALIRTGTKVPYQSGAGTNYNYVDVGVNIDCQKIQELNGQLVVQVSADITSVPAPSGVGTSGNPAESAVHGMPLVRQNRWNSAAVVAIGKATTLFSSDDLNTKRKLQLELTATPIK